MRVPESAGYGLNRLQQKWFNQPGFKKRRLSGQKRRRSSRKKN